MAARDRTADVAVAAVKMAAAVKLPRNVPVVNMDKFTVRGQRVLFTAAV